MINVNKKDLKKISREFRIIASRVLNAHYADLAKALTKLLNFIHKTPLLAEYIKSLPSTGINPEQEILEVSNGHGQFIFDLGSTSTEEIVNVFEILTAMPKSTDAVVNLCFAYNNGSSHIQDSVKEFGHRVILPFINDLENYLNNIGIDMGIDDNIQYNITVNGGQVNLSQDNSTLNAVQNNNGVDIAKMQSLIERIMQSMRDNAMAASDTCQISETLTAIKEEMSKQAPKTSVVTLLLDSLKSSATLLATIPEISQKINDFVAYIAPFIS